MYGNCKYIVACKAKIVKIFLAKATNMWYNIFSFGAYHF